MMCTGALSSARARPGEVEALLADPHAESGDSLADHLSTTARGEGVPAPLRIEALSALCLLAKSRTRTCLYGQADSQPHDQGAMFDLRETSVRTFLVLSQLCVAQEAWVLCLRVPDVGPN
jgi:hypothetical protein